MTNDDLVEKLRRSSRVLRVADHPDNTTTLLPSTANYLASAMSEAADEIERLTGIVLCLTVRWPDCNAKDCGQPCMPKAVTAR